MKWNFEGNGPTLVLYPESDIERDSLKVLRNELMTLPDPVMAVIFTMVTSNVYSCQMLVGPRADVVAYLVELRAAINTKGL